MKGLSEKIRSFPIKPGVYLMRDKGKKVIYVGKAKNLKSRISNYFGKGKDSRYQIDALMKKVQEIEYIITSNEKEAFLLEYSLIQEYKPHYNVVFKDSKRYINIKLSGHDYPGIYTTRKTPKDGSTYFGPYLSAARCREIVNLVIRYFMIRNCSDTFFSNRSRPCIQHEIKRCTAPCVKLVDKNSYHNQAESASLFLKGNIKELVTRLKSEMNKMSQEMKYEDAAHIRDIIKNIKAASISQNVSDYGERNKDYIGIYREGNVCVIAILELRSGRIQDYKTVHLKDEMEDNSAVLEQLLLQHYKDSKIIPREILVETNFKSMKIVEELLKNRGGASVKIRSPKRGVDKRRLLMATTNAKEMFKQKTMAPNWTEISLILAKKLNLTSNPRSIECVDISNISGKHAVGSLVHFFEGKPKKEKYRSYNIQTKTSPDDYNMMKEVIERRFSHNPKERPDILLVDGGIGQLMIVKNIIEKLFINDVAIAAIAKGEDKKDDNIFIVERKNNINFRNNDPAYLFLRRARDEAHRFGISHYRKRHRKDLVKSSLDKIEGVGPQRRMALLKKFGSAAAIKKALVVEIADVPGISLKLARLIKSKID